MQPDAAVSFILIITKIYFILFQIAFVTLAKYGGSYRRMFVFGVTCFKIDIPGLQENVNWLLKIGYVTALLGGLTIFKRANIFQLKRLENHY